MCINRNIYVTSWDPNISGLELIRLFIPTLTLHLGTPYWVSEVNAVNLLWSSFESYKMISLCRHGLFAQQSKDISFMGLRNQVHISTPVICLLSSSITWLFWCQAETLLKAYHLLASRIVFKTFPDLCSYFLWASQGLLVTCDLFSDLAVLASRANDEQVQLQVVQCFLCTPGNKKRMVQWKDYRSDQLLIASFRSVDFHCTVNHSLISQITRRLFVIFLFAKDSCFLIIINKKNSFAFFFPQSEDTLPD